MLRLCTSGCSRAEKVSGPQHKITLGTVNRLCNLHAGQGRLDDAEVMYERELRGEERMQVSIHRVKADLQ